MPVELANLESGALNVRVNFHKLILLFPAIAIAVLAVGCASPKP
jgi:hypothetical protein